MRKLYRAVLVCIILFQTSTLPAQNPGPSHPAFTKMLGQYYAERMQLLPIESTFTGMPGNNDKLYADFTDSYRKKLRSFFSRYLSSLKKFNRAQLNRDEQISYDILQREMRISIEGIDLGYFESWYPRHKFMPFDQKASIPLLMAQLGSGEGAQPFKTIQDYQNWQKRVTAFTVWADSAIIYFRKGIAANTVLPQALVVKIIPQMESMLVNDASKSLFYAPIKKFPADFTEEQKNKLTGDYVKMINSQLTPAYKKLARFLKKEYLPKARKSTGIAAIPNGSKQYRWLIRYWTTTDKTPEQVFETGIAEVKRIRGIMDSVKTAVGFKADLNAFFDYLETDPQFMPFKTDEEVLNAFRQVEARIAPQLKLMFNRVPKTRFEVRQTEPFRAATANAEYNPGTLDGRPGIFYIPILDAKKFNVTTGIEGLFLHEAIPGHHYQSSLQIENTDIPLFRRNYFAGAYSEGWGLYAESLGKQLGVYTDPYQYFGALAKEIHRSIRLVVDAGMHSKGWTREQAMQYMMDNMPLDKNGTIAEIERYMAIPAQALSYKIGSLKITELRQKYQHQLGSKFSLAEFHDALLEDGSMPLNILEKKMDEWADDTKTNK